MTLNELAARINATSTAHGFWPAEGRNFGEMIALAHSELSEALEAHREDKPPFYLVSFNPKDKPEGTAVELVDTMIRVLDTLYSLDVDIDHVMELKMAYNEGRPMKHGKAY